ncbi:Chromosomal replication initiator protein DnaA [Phycisphaerae bacterium RAS1]|nr:Chromosomal replication initiator protein DnaA [Phycisphaerae bacterium RAS1]
MTQTVTERLCTLCKKVSDQIGVSRYRTWFEETSRFALVGSRLNIAVPNAFVGRWISANYLSILLDAARDLLGPEASVEIDVDASLPTRTGHGLPPPCAAPAAVRGDAAPRHDRAAPRHDQGAAHVLRGDLVNFVVGDCNELAYAAACGVARDPRSAARPLVIYGGCGLGKTHLLHGICNAVNQQHPLLSWRYISGEEFTNQFINAVSGSGGSLDAFRARFRKVDLLVIDDIHFLAGKKATQQEFLHTFNSIEAGGKTVVFSSDLPPREMSMFSEALVDRMIAGIVVRLDAPDFSTRREILARRAASAARDVADDVLDFMARHITRNVRELEGAMSKLLACSGLSREPVSVALARSCLSEYLTATRPPQAADIERLVAARFGVTREEMHSDARDRAVSLSRSVAMLLVRRHTKMSFPEIGRMMGKKNHSTVLMAKRRLESILSSNGAVAWRTASGEHSLPLKELLDELERQIARPSTNAD